MKTFLVAAACGVMLTLTGCSGGGQQRGLFLGYVTDKTEEDVVAKVGKPDSIDNSKPGAPKWTYRKKTFDPKNQNQVDDKTILIFRKDSSGKFKVVQVIFE